ncbi:high-affinity nickel-transport protein [Aureococcus anophagefferens]|nr:high-affinity nickel-transport protein [Aureococcus anophagefferens]
MDRLRSSSLSISEPGTPPSSPLSTMGRKTTIASPFAMYAVRLTLGAIVAINVALVAALLSLGARYPALVSPGLLALGFGLRHGAVMLSTLGVVNLASIGPQFREWRAAARGEAEPHGHGSGATHGAASRCCKPVLASVDSQWKMYVVGVLFGLGFETASEVGLLALAAVGPKDVPAGRDAPAGALHAGMALVDTCDGLWCC